MFQISYADLPKGKKILKLEVRCSGIILSQAYDEPA